MQARGKFAQVERFEQVVVGTGFYEILSNPRAFAGWQDALFTNYGSPLTMLAVSFLLFPQLALGLSGFETGVAVMALVALNGILLYFAAALFQRETILTRWR